MPLSHTAGPEEEILWLQMGKRFQVTAIFTDADEANAHMAQYGEQGVAACFGPFIILAKEKAVNA